VIVRSFADYLSLSVAAARLIADQIRSKPNLVLGLAAGNTPIGAYRELVRLHRDENLDFSRVTLFSLDEYEGLSAADPLSFSRFFHVHLLDHINVLPQNIHLLSEHAQSTFEQSIKDAGGIDLQLLGIGKNGHIAFNEPGSAFDSRTRRVNLPNGGAVTMGIGTILEARRILLLASGPEKTSILNAAIQGPVSESVPASALQQHHDVTVLLSAEL
jgi:glucosamine-6-phosphate deaminase